MKDELGKRMKMYYENSSKYFLPKKTHYIMRIDGKSFHTYTKNLKRPFDEKFVEDMDGTAKYLCDNVQGAKFAFTQSDEISLLLTDFDNIHTQSWFGGNVQKIASISASMATAKFNELRPGKIALFDSRCFTIPFSYEVENYFIWRQQDATRNSIHTVARILYPHKELMNKDTNDMQEMIFQKGINWNDYDPKLKRGRIIRKEMYELEKDVIRSRWISVTPPIFTKDKEYIKKLIPNVGD